MSIQDEVRELAREAAKRPWANLTPRATDDALDRFEKRTGLTMPESLREWLKFSNGPTITSGIFHGIETAGPSCNMEALYVGHLAEWRRKGWI